MKIPTPTPVPIIITTPVEQIGTYDLITIVVSILMVLCIFPIIFLIKKCKHKEKSHELENIKEPFPMLVIVEKCKKCKKLLSRTLCPDWGAVKQLQGYGYSEECGCMVFFFAESNFQTSHFTPNPACKKHTGKFVTGERSSFIERGKISRIQGSII